MKKILNLLELNVQWLALGLGIVFAIYMSYAYLLEPPVSTQVATKTVSPGDIDDTIWDLSGNALSQAIDQKNGLKVDPPNLTTLFTDAIKYNQKPLPTDTLALDFPAYHDLPVDASKPALNSQNPQPTRQQMNNPVAALPTLGAPALDGVRSGMSSVMPRVNAANPGQPVEAMDVSWVTVRGEIDVAEIQQAFAAVNIPDNARKTSFILLAMEREEKLADGSWGNRTLVPHIKTADVQVIPAATAAPGDMWSYLQWAEAHTVDLMQPPFYTVAKGDPWTVPGEQAAAATPAAEAFDPLKWITAKQAEIDAMHFTNEQKQAIFKARADAAKGAGKSKGGGRASRSDEPSGPRGQPSNAPNDMARPAGARGAKPTQRVADEPDQQSEPSAGGSTVVQQANANFPLPVGAFDTADWLKQHQATSKVTVWAHDETAQPGHTYHYRLSYAIKNPIFFGVNVAKDVALTKVFAIQSKPSEWTDDVDFISTTNFWVVRPPRSSGLVDVQVFRWQAGETKSKQFSVSPGDMIGQKEGDVDFTTGWTVVDVQYDPRTQDYYMLVMDPSGLIHHRDFKTDSSDPKLKNWRDQATVASAMGPTATPIAR